MMKSTFGPGNLQPKIGIDQLTNVYSMQILLTFQTVISVPFKMFSAQVFSNIDPGPRWGSLDRALYTSSRANIIGAIHGGAYVKHPRKGNW